MNPVMMNREPAPCVLVRLACERCGPVRIALAASPAETEAELDCPYCSGAAKFDRLGEGKTTRLLPYFELESNLRQISQEPPGSASGFRRLVRGQTVIFCEEADILHYATVDEVWTNAANISPAGMPSISFMIRGLDSGPIPHVSGAVDRMPPFWCLPAELRQAAAEVEALIVAAKLTPEEKKAQAAAKRAATIAGKKAGDAKPN